MEICVIRLDHLGDLILTTPLIRALAKAGHAVDVVATAYTKPVLDHNPHVREAFAIEEIAPGFPRAWPALARHLRGRKYDSVILPFARPKELLLASMFSGARRRLAMWSGIWGRLTAHTALRSNLPESPRHMSDIWLDCARALGAEPAGLKPDLYLTDAEDAEMRGRLEHRFAGRKAIVIHPGCGGNTCNLPVTEYARLAQMIAERTDRAVVITGSAKERAAYAQWPVAESPRVWLSAGELGLRQLMALIGRADLVVCVGTGPLHIASALGRRTLSPFCPYVGVCPAVWGNLGGPAAVIEPPPGMCPRLQAAAAPMCHFEGAIDAEKLFARIDL